jgi:hypothetical protein
MRDRVPFRLKNPLSLAALSIAWLIVFTRPAAAYIDPGSGSFLLQVMIAGLISAGVAVKIFWRNIARTLFRRRDTPSDADADDR